MPQEFLVVRCYSCQTFQIHQTRKDCKFVCKICGVKQSRKKVYAQGNSKDCRIVVQNLNAQKSLDFGDEISLTFSDHEESFDKPEHTDHSKPLERSKWAEFLEPQNDFSDNDNENTLQNDKVSPGTDTKTSDRLNREVLSEIDSEESSSHTINKCLSNSFTTAKRFHDGEIKNKTSKDTLKEDKHELIEDKEVMKENAIKKFQNVDDNILDILNTSFCC
ncbi:hypothetical protein Anas_04190 [Armadillidium nasatum]|uniref:MRN complex-interacting protein N-terminal domain-containing protein n=1 Tax=Armadillidium nasatum TaxID=96803 RepID=A0A5N5TBA2_9CRUS|nr:hypothetical protein Anas_04190 [Armadillidium nasatum]